jgi:hypothetical protein
MFRPIWPSSGVEVCNEETAVTFIVLLLLVWFLRRARDLCLLCRAPSCRRSVTSSQLSDWWMMNWKGFGWKQLWPNRGNICWRDSQKPRKTSVKTVGFAVEIRIERLPNTILPLSETMLIVCLISVMTKGSYSLLQDILELIKVTTRTH